MLSEVPPGGSLVTVGTGAAGAQPLFDAGQTEEVTALERHDPVLARVGPRVHADVADASLVLVFIVQTGSAGLLRLWMARQRRFDTRDRFGTAFRLTGGGAWVVSAVAVYVDVRHDNLKNYFRLDGTPSVELA